MTPAADCSSALQVLRRDALRAAFWTALPLIAAAAAIALAFRFDRRFVAEAITVFALASFFMLRQLPSHLPHRRFGIGNRVTLGRLALIALLAGGVGNAQWSDAVAWSAVVLASVTALLDAADGPLARGDGLASDFGARFDMESDALLILVLSALVWQADKAGAWVLAAGLMRYAFVGAAALWPWLARPLAPSLRRKTVCVLQIVGLIVCLMPTVAPWLSQAIAALTLAALTASFAADVLRLARVAGAARARGIDPASPTETTTRAVDRVRSRSQARTL